MPGGQNPATYTYTATGHSAGKSRFVYGMTARAKPAVGGPPPPKSGQFGLPGLCAVGEALIKPSEVGNRRAQEPTA